MTYRFAVVFVSLVASLACQTTWTVSPGSDLDAVFAAAAPGDIVVLGVGTYAPFQLDKGLTVIGPATIEPPLVAAAPHDSSVTVPAGQQARLVGLELRPSWPSTPYVQYGHRMTVSGDASFEACTFGSGWPESLAVVGGNVLLQHCLVRGGAALGGGYRQTGGFCSIADSRIEGISSNEVGYGQPLFAKPGVEVRGGRLLASSSTFVGGDCWVESSQSAFLPPSPALSCSGTGSVSLADCTLTGGSGVYFGWPIGPGAAAVVSSADVRFARSMLTGGPGSVAGPATIGPVVADVDLVGISLDHGLLLGQAAIATATAGGSGLPLAVFGTFDHTVVDTPIAVEPVFGLLTQAVALALAAPAPGAVLTAQLNVPASLSLRGASVWLQAAQWSGAQFRLSPVVGGVVH